MLGEQLEDYHADNSSLILEKCKKGLSDLKQNAYSALYWFSASLDGHQILTNILKINPGLAETITSDALCAKRTAEAGIDENTSVLDLLKKSPDGMRLLEKIVKYHSNLAHSESRFSFFGPSSELKAKPEDSCPRFC